MRQGAGERLMKRFLETVTVSLVTAIAVVMIGFGPTPSMHAQSPRVGGRDLPSNTEQWFKRLGLLNGSAGCDVALEYDSLNTARLTDCTDSANLRDLKLRGMVITGVPVSAQGGAGVDAFLTKTVTAIADATATTVLTVSVPNAAEAAVIPVVIMTSLGAGGAVGAFECTGTAYGQIVVTRTAALATVATATTLSNAGSACVAGATTIATAYSVTSMTGANSVAQTFNVQVTITKGGGASAAHQAIVQADLLNANAAGITVS
jgi:hypothetical protein